MNLEQALLIADAMEWEGDPRVNFKLCHDAAIVLAREVRKLNAELMIEPDHQSEENHK